MKYEIISHKKNNCGIFIQVVFVIIIFSMVVLSAIKAMDNLQQQAAKQATTSQNKVNERSF